MTDFISLEASCAGLRRSGLLGDPDPAPKGARREEKSDTYGFSWLVSPEQQENSSSSLLACLISDLNWHNPTATRLMCEAFELHPFETSPQRCQGSGLDYLALREAQNLSWAESKTKDGLGRAREGQHSEAVVLFTQALQLAPRYVNARIARGCSFANMLQYDDAIRDFRRVLNHDAANEHAAAYLSHTVEQREKHQQREGYQQQRPAYLLVAEEDPREHSPDSSGEDENNNQRKGKSEGKKRKKRRKR